MTASPLPFIGLFLVLLVVSAVFSGSETAIFSLDRLTLRRFERSPSRRERLVAALAAHPERLLAGVLLGNTLVNVALSTLALSITTRLGEALAGWDKVGASVILGTVVVLIFGEVLPKGIAVHWAPRLSPLCVLVLEPLLYLLRPVAHGLERLASVILRMVGVRDEVPGPGLAPGDLRLLFEEAHPEGAGMGGDIAANVFEFFETRAYEVMTPRVDVIAVPVDLDRDELLRRAREARHSRLPVYRETPGQIIGFLSTKELLLHPARPLEELLRPVHFVPERARLHRVLAEVQARRLGLVVVVNEYGGTEGILTKEDLIEAVVGEVFDEQERDHVLPLEPAGPDAWRVDGLVLLYDLARELNVAVETGPAETVAGLVAHLLGRPPRPGDAVEAGPLALRVLQVRRHRAQRVLVAVRRPPGGTAR